MHPSRLYTAKRVPEQPIVISIAAPALIRRAIVASSMERVQLGPLAGIATRYLQYAILRRRSSSARHSPHNTPPSRSRSLDSWTDQAPTAPAQVALWAYPIADPAGRLQRKRNAASFSLDRGELTHHASSGIGGGSPDAAALVTLDAYAIAGLQPGQVRRRT